MTTTTARRRPRAFGILSIPLPILLLTGCIVPGSLLTGCQSVDDERARDQAEGHDWGEQRQQEWDELNKLKNEIRWDYDKPVTFSFPGHGDITVRAWTLEGGPGWAYVRAEFTYRNTTKIPMERVKVILSVLDHKGDPVLASRVNLTHPWGLALAPGRPARSSS